MQIGKGKQGVNVVEYGPHEDSLGYIEPAGDAPQWILWFDSKGDAVLYTERETGKENKGAVIGEPIRLKARGRNRRITGAPHASITGNMELGRIKINGEDHLTIKVDKDGGTLKHVWPDGDVNEIEFSKEDNRDIKLVGRTQTIVLRGNYRTPNIEVKPLVITKTPTGEIRK